MAEPFFWGQGGAKLTPEQLALARAVLARKNSQGVDTSPVGHWTAGAARVVDALGDVFQERRLNNQQAENDQYNVAQTGPLIAALTGGSAAPVVAAPVASGGAPVASQPQTSSAAVAAPVFANDGTELGAILSNDSLRATLPAGMRNNNPGNIKFVGQKVAGIVGPSVNTDQGDPQAVFDTPESGMRAMHGLLNRKYTGGKLTPNQMIAGNMGWTPGNYGAAANVAKTMGISPDEDIGFNNPERAAKFMQALILQEHGQKGRLYPTSLITSAITGTPSATPAAQAIEQAAPSSGYVDPMVSVQPNAMAPELPAPVEVAARPVASAPVATAPQQSSPPPAVLAQALRVMADPRANENTKAVAQALIQRQQAQEQAQQEQSVWMQRQQYAQQQQQNDPMRQLQMQEAQLKIAAMQDPNENVPDAVKSLDLRAQRAGLQPGSPEYNNFFVTQGVKPPANVGAPPAGYQIKYDASGNPASMEPIPGSPAALEAEARTKMMGNQQSNKSTSSDVITNAARLAREAAQAPGLPATGMIGGVLSGLPETNAAELRRQVGVLTSNATVENLNAMRAASPTGGALGSVTEKEGAMLAAKSGALDPNSPNFSRDLEDYERTLLRVVHGQAKGDELFTQTRPSSNPDIQAAKDAIAKGAPREMVIKRLQDAGLDTEGL